MFIKSSSYIKGKFFENMAVLLTYGFGCGGRLVATFYSVAVILMQHIICYSYLLLEIEFILVNSMDINIRSYNTWRQYTHNFFYFTIYN